jgi:two-component system LytT family response regulator
VSAGKTPSSIATLIVDDETLARDAIRLRLGDADDFCIVGEASDGPEAVRQLGTLRPDLVFLDIQMPEMNGFDVHASLPPEQLPLVVFVTAFDHYALRAFETHALDYLLKPFTAARFETALDRVRVEVAKGGDDEAHKRLLALIQSRTRTRDAAERTDAPFLSRLTVKHQQRIKLVKVEDIEWIESSANYACLHVAGATYVVRMTMAELERRLDPECFARIHRSTIVQINRIREIVPAWHGDFDLTLLDGTVLRLTRNYRSRLMP